MRPRIGSLSQHLNPDALSVPDWHADALCAQVGGDLWFPVKGDNTSAPKRVCQSCPVRGECLDWALQHHERFGVWGGLTATERRPLLDRRPLQPCGTHAAYARHRNAGEVPCEACTVAHRGYERDNRRGRRAAA